MRCRPYAVAPIFAWSAFSLRLGNYLKDGTGREIVRQFTTRKLQNPGQLIRYNASPLQLIEGNIEGRRFRGRPRNTWTTDISNTTGRTFGPTFTKV